MSFNAGEYIVVNEKHFCYELFHNSETNGSRIVGVIKKDGIFSFGTMVIDGSDTVRPATDEDFDKFRVARE